MTSATTGPLSVGLVGPVGLQTLTNILPEYRPATNGLGSPVITDLAEWLHRRGHDVHVFTLSVAEEDHGSFGVDRFTLHVGRYRARGRARDAFGHEIAALMSAIQRDPPALLHAHWTYEFALAALHSGLPTLVTVHDWAPTILRLRPDPYRVVRLWMNWRVLRRAEHLSAISPYIAEGVERWVRRPVPVVPNGIALPSRSPCRRTESGRLVLGSLNNGFGRLKNVTALLEAFALVRREIPGSALRLAGAGFEREGAARQWARGHQLDEGVDFIGPIPASEVPAFMRSLDVLVHPSLEESFGRALIEAIVEGTLVVGGIGSGAVPWVLGEGAAGVLVDTSQPDAIAGAVARLHEHRSDWPKRRDRALDHVSSRFSRECVVGQWEALYEQVLAQA